MMNKKYKMIIMGLFNPVLSKIIASFQNIKIKYYIKDNSVEDDGLFERFWEEHGAVKAELKEKYLNEVDLVFLCGYKRIIRSEFIDKYIFINIHAGNLPKWRGTSANSWAILNGDYCIAYSLHRVTGVLDGGAVYSKFEYYLKNNEKYGDGRKKIEGMLESGLETALIGICDGSNKGEKQTGQYVYCCSFKKSDGVISDWNVDTRRLLDLFRVFGTPYGSGMFIHDGHNQYELMDIASDDNFFNYYCIPGAVVNNDGKYIWIKTRDNVVKIKKIKDMNGKEIDASDIFKIGIRL